MVVPEYQDGKSDDSMITLQKIPDITENTRKAGGQQQTEVTCIIPKIVVDIREFRSDLPCLIHRRGIEVVPVTITVIIQALANKRISFLLIFFVLFTIDW